MPSYRNTRPASLAAHSSGPLVPLQLRQLQLGRRAGLPLEAGRPGGNRGNVVLRTGVVDVDGRVPPGRTVGTSGTVLSPAAPCR